MSPATFIPMAENLGLMRELGAQILEQGLAALAHWRERGFPLHLAVNVSRRQLFTPDLVTRLPEQLVRHGLVPGDLVLEVTESVATQEAAHTIERLRALDAAGFRIAVDDFGTGYSSLSQLHELPVDELKIDQSFVRRIHDPAGRSMVEAILHIAGSLRLQTVAEGVEDASTAALLKELKVDFLQGYHFARPMPPGDFTHWLAHTIQ